MWYKRSEKSLIAQISYKTSHMTAVYKNFQVSGASAGAINCEKAD
jgi:hypothetical protein